MLIKLQDGNKNFILDLDSIEFVDEVQIDNPDYVPSINGVIEGNSEEPVLTKTIIKMKSGKEFIVSIKLDVIWDVIKSLAPK
jgi:hypothetical protein